MTTKSKILKVNQKIEREYDVDFYMKRGLSKTESIDYILNKLKIEKLKSKMSRKIIGMVKTVAKLVTGCLLMMKSCHICIR